MSPTENMSLDKIVLNEGGLCNYADEQGWLYDTTQGDWQKVRNVLRFLSEGKSFRAVYHWRNIIIIDFGV